jgi:TetR/AcrR family transcriptional regulator, cholesterol catabolism regulator
MTRARAANRKIREHVASLKRERIIDAATDLFYDKGFRNTTLEDVADRLGTTKPALYTSFASKTELLAEICTRGVASALDEIEQAMAQGLSPRETLGYFVPRYVTAIIRLQKHIAINIREEKNLDPSDAERLAELRHRFIACVEDMLRAGRDAGEIDVAEPRIAAFAIVGAVSWTTFWYNPSGALSSHSIAQRMADVILGLVRTRSESAVIET